jgi:pimeloyl-ACP methyl ester carboxylesterase
MMASVQVAGYVPRRPSMARTAAEFAALARRPRLDEPALADLAAGLPRGDGSAVLALPGVFRDDRQTADLRCLLQLLGYAAFGWGLGMNHGPSEALRLGALARLAEISQRHGPVSLVGFSMGGLFARWLAVRATSQVRQVITIGSPLRSALRSAFLPSSVIVSAWRGRGLRDLADEIEAPLAVPAACVFSRRDGIVAWDSCRDPRAPEDNFEVECPHVRMEADEQVFRIVAERLSKPGKGV